MPTALHPLVFLPFHLVGTHLTARVFPKKAITYPALHAFFLLQYAVEHFSAELPTLAAMGPLLVLIALAIGPVSMRYAYKRTVGSKRLVVAAIAAFPVLVGFFKGTEFGFPKDDPVEQAIANQDYLHSVKHLVLHIVLVFHGLALSCGVPWEATDGEANVAPPVQSPRAKQPSSPARTFLKHAKFAAA